MDKILKTHSKNYNTEKTRRNIALLKSRGGRVVNFTCEKDILDKLESIRLALELNNRQQVLEYIVLSYELPIYDGISLYDR